MQRDPQRGQATLLVVVALSLFLIGAVGLAIDASHLYAQRQMAQAAADAAATAALHAMYSRTNTATYNNDFGSATFTCAAGSNLTPCYQARLNGFDAANGDVIEVSFPGSVPGVTLTPGFNPAAVTVLVTRTVDTTLMGILGPAASNVAARATGAMLEEISPVPILVLHPDKPASYEIIGNPNIQICGGPQRSIQVNASSSGAVLAGGSSMVDLSTAGPTAASPATPCDPAFPSILQGTGADFGNFGGPDSYPAGSNFGSGQYRAHTGPIHDPLKDVPNPPIGTAPLSPTWNGGLPVAPGVNGCPAGGKCQLFLPGRYSNGIRGQGGSGARTNGNACTAALGGTGSTCYSLFAPGIYYMEQNGFHGGSNSDLRMATCSSQPGSPVPYGPDADTSCGLLIYNTGSGSDDIFEVGANGNAYLVGPPNDSVYKGIVLFQDRDPSAGPHNSTPGSKPHRLGGGGAMTLIGTVYATRWETCPGSNPSCSRMLPGTTNYQAVDIRGTAGNTTQIVGMIITSVLQMGGGGIIKMTLDPSYRLNIIHCALVQ
jgi:Flp pilus assembly protein TadG